MNRKKPNTEQKERGKTNTKRNERRKSRGGEEMN